MATDKPITSSEMSELRRQAEIFIQIGDEDSPSVSPAEVKNLVHDLRTRQLELELQNQQLHETHEELQDANNRLSDLYDFAPVGYLTINEKDVITAANLTAAELFGVEREHLLKQAFTEFITEEGQDVFYLHRREVKSAILRGEKKRACELQLNGRNGKPFWATLECTIVFDSVSGPHIRITIADVSEIHLAREMAETAVIQKYQLDRQFHQAQKLESLGVMAGGIAHDFNNLLTIIQGNAELALKQLSSGSTSYRQVAAISKATERAVGLTSQMLAYSGKDILSIERLNLSDVVEEVAGLLKVTCRGTMALEYQIDIDLRDIEGDRSQIRQVIINLVNNASDAVSDGVGVVRIGTGLSDITSASFKNSYVQDLLPPGRYVYLEVNDNGCGLDEATQLQMFDPFFTTRFAGRGLSLAATLGIVRSHHGTILVESKSGSGTTIKALFPVSDNIVKLQHGEIATQDEKLAQGTILVVDDEPSIREVLAYLLVSKGFTVITAADGLQAVNEFRAHQDEIVCVLVDLVMPQMDGPETCSELRKIQQDVPVILTTEYSEEMVPVSAARQDFTGFLQKPIKTEALYEEVRSVLSI